MPITTGLFRVGRAGASALPPGTASFRMVALQARSTGCPALEGGHLEVPAIAMPVAVAAVA